MTIQDIYRIIDEFAPFSTQESYDKSGLLVGDPQTEVRRVLLTLDITVPVIREAAAKKADLILSHHPVIWDPLKSLSPAHPVWHLVQNGIGAICAHTNIDLAEGGLNDQAGDLIAEALPMTGSRKPLARLSGDRTLGRVCSLAEPVNPKALAECLRRVFRCGSLRYFAADPAQSIRTIAWCTGSGCDLIPEAIAAGADALISADAKHSVWADAQNRGFTLYDCGHFETEVGVVRLFRDLLARSAPELETVISEAGTMPFFHALPQENTLN